jgi:hypothetical protein
MTMTVSKRLDTAKRYLKDASVPNGRLNPQSRFEFAIDAAYLAALEVAVQAGYDLHPWDEDSHPISKAVHVALRVLQVAPLDKSRWPLHLYFLRQRFAQPLQEPPGSIDDTLAWAQRTIDAAERYLASRP